MLAPCTALAGRSLAFQHALFLPPPKVLETCRREGTEVQTILGQRKLFGRVGVRLGATKGEEEAAKRGGRKGFYVRPSKAVELGGGFYVPGLEGPKLRIAIGTLALLLFGITKLSAGYEPLESQKISEAITALTTVLLLGQALFETATGAQGITIVAEEDGGVDKAEKRPSVVRCSGRLSGRRKEDELWVLSAALSVLPACSVAITLDEGGYLAACSPEECADEQGSRAHAACVRLVAGRAAVGIDRSEGGSDAEEVLSILPKSCSKALVCGSQSRVIVLGMPAGAPEVGSNQALWISQLSTLPSV